MFAIDKTLKIVLVVTLALLAAPLALRASGESPSIPGFSLDEIDRRDNEILNLDLSRYNPDSPSAFQDIPPDHWAYKSVQYLAGVGFLEGYDGKQFRGDQVVTRYELAIIVSKMLQNYNKFLQNGYVERNLPIEKNWPDAEEFPPPQVSYMPEPVRAARTLPQTVRLKKIQEPPPGPMSPAREAYPTYIPTTAIPSYQSSSRAYSSDELQLLTGPGAPGHARIYYQPPTLARGEGTLKQSGPKSFDTPPSAATATVKTTGDKDAKDKDKSKDKEKPKEKLKIPKELKKISDKFEITEKDVEIFEALVKYIKDEMKDSEKETKKSISEVKRMAKKNEGDIEKLEQNNQRYKINGGAKFQISSSQTTYGASDSNYSTSVGDSAWTWSSVYSKPRRLDDLVLTYSGSGSGVNINYQDFSSSREHPRNFKLRGLYTGGVGMAYSPLSVFGTSMTGFTSSFLLNKYELQLGLGRKSSVEYLYGAAVKTSLFNNPSSFLWITRLMSFQDKDVLNSRAYGDSKIGLYGCNRADGGWADTFYPVGSWTSGSSICLPPFKNSISSIFVQTPIPLKGWSIWAEYAHSTYFRPGFNLAKSNKDDATNNYSNLFKPVDKYVSWRPIKERRDSDEGFLVLFVYNKGPISIFPLGYVHLGSEFVSRNLGMPGLDTSSLSLDALPINLQSMDLFIIRPTINKSDDRWKDDFMYLVGGEHNPMYLDPSAMGSQPTLVNFSIFDRLNNRGTDAMLRLSVFTNSFTYYVSDKMQLSASYSNVRAALGPGCIDANVSIVRNDAGDPVDKQIGNGVTNCTEGDPAKDPEDLNPVIRYKTQSQSYSLYWKTSKRADMNFSVGKSNNKANISFGAGSAVDDAIKELIPATQKQSLSASLNYRLTDISTVSMWYNDGYIAHLGEFYKNNGALDTKRISAMGDSVGFSLEMSF